MENEKKVKKVIEKTVKAQDFLDVVKSMNVAITTDKHNRTTIRKDNDVLTYISDRKKGFSYSVKDPSIKWGWKSILVTTKEDMDKKIEEFKELVQ